MSTSTQDSLPRFPFQAPTPWDPPPEFERLRHDSPVVRVRMPTGDDAWLVTRYEDNKQLLADPRFSRAAANAPGAPRLQPIPPDPSALISMDPPAHTRLRKLVSRAFTTRRIQSLIPRAEEITADLLARMAEAGPPADLVHGLALPLPMNMICELLGVPFTDRDNFRRLGDVVLSLTAHSPAEVQGAREELSAYLAELVTSKRRAPGDDLMSALVAVHDQEETRGQDALTHDELVALGRTLLTAGFHTTANQITLSVLCLLRHPCQLSRLASEPDALQRTVEELLRFNGLTVGGGLIRIATEDVELGGVLIPAGAAVLPAITSANRDASAFSEPNIFDPERADNPHIAFGHGMHYCLGAQLARMELRVALGALARQFPSLKLAVRLGALPWNTGRMFRGITELPVAW